MDFTPVVLERSYLHLKKIFDQCGCTNVLPLLIKHGHVHNSLPSLDYFMEMLVQVILWPSNILCMATVSGLPNNCCI
jgi:hypothetical protein